MKFKFNHLEKSVLDSLSKKGRVYLVGGIVRDMVMYQKVDYHDVDVEIYDLEIDEIIDILSQYGKVNEVGKSFGILKLDCLPNFDFALPRIERKKGQTHREFEVEVHKDLDMKTACRRRDFTINAMMYDYQNEKLIDYYQGQEDIKNKCLKMVDEKTFYEYSYSRFVDHRGDGNYSNRMRWHSNASAGQYAAGRRSDRGDD